MVRAAALIALFTLTGCSTYSPMNGWTPEHTAETADIARVNSVNALQRISELESRIDDLERDKQDLESRIDDLESKLK